MWTQQRDRANGSSPVYSAIITLRRDLNVTDRTFQNRFQYRDVTFVLNTDCFPFASKKYRNIIAATALATNDVRVSSSFRSGQITFRYVESTFYRLGYIAEKFD